MSALQTRPLFPTPPPLRDPCASWRRIVLDETFEQIRREYRAELASKRSGSRHRLAELLQVAERLAGQIEMAEGNHANG